MTEQLLGSTAATPVALRRVSGMPTGEERHRAVAERIRVSHDHLTVAERRVAEIVLATPASIGFGTVADVASAAGVGAATVVRFATKLGFEGFTDLQERIRDELVHQLRPASERIREQSGRGVVEAHAAVEMSNVQGTLDGADPGAVGEVVHRLADLTAPVAILSGEASTGVAQQFVTDLASLRPDVVMIGGNDVAVRRMLALLPAGAMVVALDVRRYDRWLVDAVQLAADRDCWVVALTDSMLSPLARSAAHTFVLSAGAVGPFDSHVGTLALLNLFVTEVAGRLRDTAPARLDRVEAAWRTGESLVDP